MPEFIFLHLHTVKNGLDRYVNLSHVAAFYEREGKTILLFGGGMNVQFEVRESVEEIKNQIMGIDGGDDGQT